MSGKIRERVKTKLPRNQPKKLRKLNQKMMTAAKKMNE